MSTEYAPGTVAVATVRGERQRLMWCQHSSTGAGFWTSETGQVGPLEIGDSVTDVRPLVVLDLDYIRREPLGLPKVLDSLRAFYETRAIADQIEAQTRAKPAEPTGCYAVVEDSEAREWCRIDTVGDYPWQLLGQAATARLRYSGWSDIDAVRVLSEGVTA